MADITRRTFLEGGALAAVTATGAIARPGVADAAGGVPGAAGGAVAGGSAAAVRSVPAFGSGPSVGSVSATNSALNGLTGWVVPTDWGSSWRAKLNAASAGQALAVAAVLGDSNSFGYWASDLAQTSWVERLRAMLASVAGNGGSGFQSQARSSTVMYNPNAGVPSYYKSVAANVWAQSAGWRASPVPHNYGPGAGSLEATVAGASVSNFIIGSQLGIWYYDGGADFTVQIDGQTVATVTVGTSNLPIHSVFDVPGGVVGIHSWKIIAGYNATTAVGTTICGVEGLAPTGVRIDNFAFPGLSSAFWNNTDQPVGSGTYAGGFRNPADLVIYELGGIDMVSSTAYAKGMPADTWAQNVESYLAGVMNNTFGGDARGLTDVLFLFPIANSTADVNRLFLQYKARSIGIAQSYGAALLDMNAMWHSSWNAWQKAGYAGNQAVPKASGTDYNHPSDGGHLWMAQQLLQLLGALS
jgi:hypothetical protein